MKPNGAMRLWVVPCSNERAKEYVTAFHRHHGANVVEYSYPLRPDCTVYLRLPKDLRLNEARRIARMLETLVDVEATSGFDPVAGPVSQGDGR